MPSQRPHILLITTDQQRGDALGINGNRFLETPNLDALAARGLNFNRAYVTCPVCIPARRTLISGQSPDSHGLRRYREDLDWDPPATLPGLLSQAGYQTQLVGKLHLHPQGKTYGYDNIVLSETSNWRPGSTGQRRNDYVRWLREHGILEHPHFHGISGNGRIARPWPLEERFHQNKWLAEEAVRFLDEDRDPTRPFFLHLSFFHPHPPLVPVAHYFDRYLGKDLPPPVLGQWSPRVAEGDPYPPLAPDAAVGPFDPEIIRRATAAYYALITQIDDCVAHVLERWLEHANPRRNEPIYILFSSDHGEMLGDHHLFRKSLGYEASARVPFFISGANVPLPAARSEELACWEDIAPTLLDLAGAPVPEWMDGRSLAGLLRSESGPGREFIFGQCEGWMHNLWIADARYKYLWFPRTNEEQLFDLAEDPNETTDLSAQAALLRPMRERMTECVAGREDLRYDPAELRPCAGEMPLFFWPALPG